VHDERLRSDKHVDTLARRQMSNPVGSDSALNSITDNRSQTGLASESLKVGVHPLGWCWLESSNILARYAWRLAAAVREKPKRNLAARG
jgi:hypothetical protein